MILHVSVSHGRNCGIASFASKLHNELTGDTKLVNAITTTGSNTDILLVEHEYGLHQEMNINSYINFPGTRVVIMHAFSDNPNVIPVNEQIFRSFDKIVFLTSTAMIKAATKFSQYADKMSTIKHYVDKVPSFKPVPSGVRIGVHGFGLARNGFSKIIEWTFMNASKIDSVYMSASLSTFNETSERESSIYIDGLRSRISKYNLQDKIELDFNYYDTKEEVRDILAQKCNRLVHLTSPTLNYYNASGSLVTLMASGIPVYAFESVFTENFPKDTFNAITSLDDLLKDSQVNNESIMKYFTDNNVKRFANNLLDLIGK